MFCHPVAGRWARCGAGSSLELLMNMVIVQGSGGEACRWVKGVDGHWVCCAIEICPTAKVTAHARRREKYHGHHQGCHWLGRTARGGRSIPL